MQGTGLTPTVITKTTKMLYCCTFPLMSTCNQFWSDMNLMLFTDEDPGESFPFFQPSGRYGSFHTSRLQPAHVTLKFHFAFEMTDWCLVVGAAAWTQLPGDMWLCAVTWKQSPGKHRAVLTTLRWRATDSGALEQRGQCCDVLCVGAGATWHHKTWEESPHSGLMREARLYFYCVG